MRWPKSPIINLQNTNAGFYTSHKFPVQNMRGDLDWADFFGGCEIELLPHPIVDILSAIKSGLPCILLLVFSLAVASI